MPFRRGNPFEELEEMFERMGREFEADFGGGTQAVSVDVADHGEKYVVTADLPGFEKDDIDVTIADTTLRIVAEHTESVDEGDAEYLRRERRRESLSRSVRLPEAVDDGSVEAAYANGVLAVTLPKAAGDDDGRRIEIE